MSLIAGGGEPPSGLSAFKTVGSQLAVTAGTLLCNKLLNRVFDVMLEFSN